MLASGNKLGQVLIESGEITAEDLEGALAAQSKTKEKQPD